MRGAYSAMRRTWNLRQLRFIPTCVGHTNICSVFDFIRLRFIPTCVGHTRCAALESGAKRRFIPTCVGHTAIRAIVGGVDGGSSPHAWGILVTVLISVRVISVHPHMRGAYVRSSGAAHDGRTVHPHMRGAYGVVGTLGLHLSDGSSPHAWGIHVEELKELDVKDGSSPHAWGILLSVKW